MGLPLHVKRVYSLDAAWVNGLFERPLQE